MLKKKDSSILYAHLDVFQVEKVNTSFNHS